MERVVEDYVEGDDNDDGLLLRSTLFCLVLVGVVCCSLLGLTTIERFSSTTNKNNTKSKIQKNKKQQ